MIKFDSVAMGAAVGYLGVRSLMQQRGGKAPIQLADLLVSAQIYIVIFKLRETNADEPARQPQQEQMPLAPYVGAQR